MSFLIILCAVQDACNLGSPFQIIRRLNAAMSMANQHCIPMFNGLTTRQFINNNPSYSHSIQQIRLSIS